MVSGFPHHRRGSGLLQRQELSPLELVESRLERIARLDGSLNSFICVLAEQALAEAPAAEAK